MEKKLTTKRKVNLKEMSLDDMDYCGDLHKIGQDTDGMLVISGINKANTAWIRKGLAGGDFKTEINGSIPDAVIKELSETEKIELVALIKEYNQLGE